MTIDKSDYRLTAYALDELREADAAEFEAELEHDQDARHELDEIQRTLSALRSESCADEAPKLSASRRELIRAAATAQKSAPIANRTRRVWAGLSIAGVAAGAALLATTGVPEKEGLTSVETHVVPPGAATSASEGTALDRPPEAALAATPPPPVAAVGPRPVPRGEITRGLRAPGAEREVSGIVGRAVGSQSRAPRYGTFDMQRAAPSVTAQRSVKAGEWDDNANYREFLRWLASQPAAGAHFMDLRDRRFIVVRDVAGRGVPSCPVQIEDESGRRAELVTAATGRAILFPHAEGLAGREFTASTSCGGEAATRFELSQSDGAVVLQLQTPRAMKERSIDLAFVLDSTGSMSEEIAAVKATIQKVASSLKNADVRIRVGLVEFKDRSDPYVTRVFPLSTELGVFSQEVAALSAGGGGDEPESVNEALHVAVDQLAWNDNAFAKLAFLVGDAPPHLDYAQDYDYALEAREAAHRGIQVFTVAASGMDTLGQVVWRQVAAYTGATNLFVLRGGAGSQSTGGGDPKSSCGGTQTSYTSGNLDALVLAKVHAAVRALDRDPMRIAGLHTDENAKPCAGRILP